MIKNITRKYTLRLLLVVSSVLASSADMWAQDEVNQLIKGGVEDANKLVGGYISPFMRSFSSGLNQGWYNTAKPHKIAGFDLTFGASLMYIPSADKFYNVNNLGLQFIELADDQDPAIQNGNVPTVFGPEVAPMYKPVDSDLPEDEFEGPPGVDPKENAGINAVPVPYAQLGFGLPKGTDIKIRLVPKIDIGDAGAFNLFGIGVMHDIKQWIPGLRLSPFDLSGFVGYTRLKLEGAYEDPNAPDLNQRGEFTMNATTIQGIISKKISVLTFYGGIGYNIARSRLAILGDYDLDDDGDADVTDPLNIKTAASGPRATVGMRLKLAVLTIHGDYTIQKYKSLSVGLGINVR